MTSQDFDSRIDLTGLTQVTGSEMNQLVEAAKTAEDKGLTITTTDTQLDVPDVPNPDQVLEGVSVDHWERYLWIRRPFGPGAKNKHYTWNPLAVEDATYLKWELVIDEAYILATLAQVQADVAEALQNSEEAVTAATGATTTANEANMVATTTVTVVNNLLNTVNTNTEAIAALDVRVSAIEGGSNVPDPLPISRGGTGAETPSGAKSNLGLQRVPIGSWYLSDYKGQNVSGGGLAAGVWTTRDINTRVYTNQNIETYCTIDSVAKTFSLLAGVWEVEIECPAVLAGLHKIRLATSDEAAIYAYGTNGFGSADAQCVTHSKIVVKLELAATTVFKVQHNCSITNLVNGAGIATNLGPEKYTAIKLTYLGDI